MSYGNGAGLLRRVKAVIVAGEEIQKSKEGQEDQLCLPMAQVIHQADQAAVWPEPVPNALAHFWQRSSDRLRPGVPASRLSHLEAQVL